MNSLPTWKAFFILAMVFIVGTDLLASTPSLALSQDPQNQQQLRPLTLSQVEDLISSTPDANVAVKIQQRGIAFQLNSKVLDDLRKLGAGPKTMQSLNTKLQTALEKEDPCQSIDRIVILVANFKSLDDKESDAAFAETILDQLREATRKYREIEIQALNESISPQEGREIAIAKGRDKRATIVLWGWYKKVRGKVSLTTHFDPVQSIPRLCLSCQQLTEVFALAEIESFAAQMQVSKQLTYLTLLTAGFVRLQADDYDAAIERLTGALQYGTPPEQIIGPSFLYFNRGKAYFLKASLGAGANGLLESAIADFTKATQLETRDPSAYLLLGYAYAQSAEANKALDAANKVLELKAEPIQQASAFCLIAMVNSLKGNNDKTKEYSARAIEILESLDQSEETFSLLSHVYLTNHDVVRAASSLEQAAKLSTCPILKVYYAFRRAILYGSTGNLDKAIEDLNYSIRMRPDFAYAYWVRGASFSDKKDYNRAIADYSAAIKLNSNVADFYHDRGNAREALDQWEEAIADYKKAAEVNPGFSAAFYDLGQAFGHQEQISEAIESYGRYIQLEPRDFDGYRQRAQLYEKKGEYDLAITDFKTALGQTSDPQLKKLAEAYIQVLVAEKDLKEFDSKRKGVKPR
jgi:tetratricopeptide (TPR) repeat protein